MYYFLEHNVWNNPNGNAIICGHFVQTSMYFAGAIRDELKKIWLF